jgi:hypothetical protein
MSKQASDSFAENIASFVIDFFQVLSFVIPDRLGPATVEMAEAFGWPSSRTAWLGNFSALLRVYPLLKLSPIALTAMWVVVISCVVFIIALAIFVFVSFSKNSFTYVIRLSVLLR